MQEIVIIIWYQYLFDNLSRLLYVEHRSKFDSNAFFFLQDLFFQDIFKYS